VNYENAVILPHLYKPRTYQKRFFSVANRKFKFCYLVWPRRNGKDVTCWNFLIKEAFKVKGTYLYIMPTFSQCKRNLWDSISSEGVKFLDYIPKEIIQGKPNESELQIELTNGSIIQLISGEKYNRLRGVNAKGVIISEFAFCHPRVLKVLRPILAESGGFLILNTTPNGENHAYDLWKKIQDSPEWFKEILTIRDTKRDDGSPVISEDEVRRIQKEEGLTDEDINAEYYCSFEGSKVGSYYGKLMQDAEQAGRIGAFPWDPKLAVYTAWDIGVSDSTAIWFYQLPFGSINIIDHYENVGEGIEHYIKYINSKPYTYMTHFMPHDFRNRVFANGAKSAYDSAVQLQNGKNNFYIVPKSNVQVGIQEVRSILPRCQFNRTNTETGMDALRDYHSKYNIINGVSSIRPEHTWSSNSADAFRMLALSIPSQKRQKTQQELDEEVNPLNRAFSETVDNWLRDRNGWMSN
jgi:hypothetical protein